MSFFGLLTFQSFYHAEAAAVGAQLMVVLGGVGILGYLTIARRWGWLWREWLTSTSPMRIGIMYILLSAVMGLRGFADASLMREQQALPVGLLSPDHYAQIFTAHGVIMIFFVAMPFMFGLINCIVPLQLGARDVAFPLLNSVSFWLT
ncbi:MAG TPA: cbb3-type cytochrome c oxidase subunit I, partial [Candidatus Paceibacterota bacterium]